MALFYVTFMADQKHLRNNVFFDSKCVGVVKADVYIEAHKKCMAEFGHEWDRLGTEMPRMQFYPRGLIEVS